MVKRNAIATKLTKICTQTQKRAFDAAVGRGGQGIWILDTLLPQNSKISFHQRKWGQCSTLTLDNLQ